MKTIISLTFLSLLFSFSAEASYRSCFSITVTGRSDIALMMTSLSRKVNTANFKLESQNEGKVNKATFHVLTISEKFSKKLFSKIMDNNGKYQKYIEVLAGNFVEGDDSCKYFDSIKSDL